MKTFRKIVIVAVLVAMLCTLVACKNNNDSKVISNEEFTIRLVGTTSGLADSLKNKFNEYFPNATFEYVYNPPTTNNSYIKEEFDNGTGPEISIVTDYDYFVENEYFMNITSESVLSKYNNTALAKLKRNSSIYAVPIGNGKLYGLIYNKTMFDEYNLAYPSASESIYDLVARVNQKITDESITGARAIALSLIYPETASYLLNFVMAEYTQSTSYLNFLADYKNGDKDFTASEFQTYLNKVEAIMNGKYYENSQDITTTEKEEVVKVINFTTTNAGAFMTVGDISFVPNELSQSNNIGNTTEYVATGVPTGNGSYVSFASDTYLGVNSKFSTYSSGKQAGIRFILNEVCGGEYTNLVAPGTIYTSNYLDGQTVQTLTDTNSKYYNYYKNINDILAANMVADDVNNNTFNTILGSIITAWADKTLNKYTTDNTKTNIEIATDILENYRKTGESPFESSYATLATLSEKLVFTSDTVRTQETELCDFFADSARAYMGSDIAIINSGSFRATIPENVSGKTIKANFPYANYLINVKMTGKTLKAFVKQAVFTTATFHSGKFPGGMSGLKITYGTSDSEYAEFQNKVRAYLNDNPDKSENEAIKYVCVEEQAEINTWVNNYTTQFKDWLNENPTASLEQCTLKIRELAGIDTIHIMEAAGAKQIVVDYIDSFNYISLKEVTLADGTPIDDNKYYTVTMTDYMLNGKDGYTRIQILNPVSDTDTSIEIYDRAGNKITGADATELSNNIKASTKTLADGFIEYFTELGKNSSSTPHITVELDGRFNWVNKVYYRS